MEPSLLLLQEVLHLRAGEDVAAVEDEDGVGRDVLARKEPLACIDVKDD